MSQTEQDLEEFYRETEQFNICSKKLGMPMPFIPSREALMSLSYNDMSKHRITHILHDGDHMHYLSFKFSNDFISPPLNSYKDTPKEEGPIPPFPEVAQIKFNTWKNTHGVIMLYSITMLSDKQEKILDIHPKDKSSRHHKLEVIDLKPGERICSVAVTVDKD